MFSNHSIISFAYQLLYYAKLKKIMVISLYYDFAHDYDYAIYQFFKDSTILSFHTIFYNSYNDVRRQDLIACIFLIDVLVISISELSRLTYFITEIDR